jgi:hypothetical protein
MARRIGSDSAGHTVMMRAKSASAASSGGPSALRGLVQGRSYRDGNAHARPADFTTTAQVGAY